ncbi:hypothetical protein GYMLUDRAFT_63703 [Collybiopsis luxurians FD-317 M1]|uniref:Unplaced genomic scaffold GYMLUscaffold_81, whole genome shotgun sequence n=1 Tax=Collybiopsis luxurians FD-317 M1 TaxID=944289 RepID=A0A0D0ASQ4_9AGAR|nr:hypothetical protein GYMLUDRAFT_63703 [Collybiopsis luxurians FD-317 M1]
MPVQDRHFPQHVNDSACRGDCVDVAVQTGDHQESDSESHTVFYWLDKTNVHNSNNPVKILRKHVGPAGRLALELYRVLDEHAPCNEDDISLIHSSVCSMQLALGTRSSTLIFDYYSCLKYPLPSPPWDETTVWEPVGTDEDAAWVYKSQVLPLRQKSARAIEKWGTGRTHSRISNQAQKEVYSVYSEWYGFYDFPQDYFGNVRDNVSLFKEMCCTVFALGVTLARIDYVLSGMEN